MPSGTKLVIKNVPHRKRAWTNQLEFLKKSVIPAMKKVDYSFLFWVKVNTKDFPTYPNIVKCPMDFSIIENRLKEHYYESAKDCIRDINLVFANCYIFSQAGEDITLIGEHMLRDKFLKKMQDFPQEEMPLERKKRGPVRKRAPHSPADDSDGHLSARRHSLESVDSHSNPAFITDGSEISPGNGEAKGRSAIISRISKDPDQPARREREARPQMSMSLNAVSTITPLPETKPRIKLIPSLNRCLKIVNDLIAYRRRKFNWPFTEPVDPVSLKLPDYFQVVKQPMDLSTIKKGLESGSYTHKSQVKEHIDLMLANCYLYNGHDSVVAECGRTVGAFFEKKFAAIPDDLEVQQGATSAGKKHKHHKHHKTGKRSKLDLLPDDVEKINVVTQQLQEVVERMSSRCAELDRLSRVITAYDESYPAPLSTESFMRQIHAELRALPSLNGQRSAGRPRKRSMAAEAPLKRKRPRVNGKEEEEEEEGELSYEEKEALSQALQRVTDASLLNELGAIVQRFEPQVQSASSGELNVDLTALNNSTLVALRRAMETTNAQGTTVQRAEEEVRKDVQEEEEEEELELELEMEGEKEEVEKAPRGRRNRKAVNPVRNRGVPTVLTAAPEPPVPLPAPVLPVEEPVASTSAAPPPTAIEEEVAPAKVASPQPTASSSSVPVPEKLPPVLEPPPPIITEPPPEQPVSLPPVIRKGERENQSGEPSQNHRSPLPAPPKPEEGLAPPKLESSTPVRRRSSSLAILSSDENDYVSNRSDSEDDHEKESPTKSDDEFKGPPLVSQQCPRRSVYDIFNDDKAESKRRNAKSKEEMGLMDIQSTYKALILQNKTDMLTKEVQRDLATKERREEEERRKREDEERKRREEKAKEARKEALKEQERKRLNEIRARNRRADMPLRQYADMANFEKKLDFSLLSPRWV